MLYSFCYPSIKTCQQCPMYKPYKVVNNVYYGVCRHTMVKGLRNDNPACLYAIKRYYERIAQ